MVITQYSFEPPNEQLQEIIHLDQEFFPKPWSHALWQELNWNKHRLILAVDKEKLVGFAIVLISSLEQLGHLLKILVLPDSRRLGVASKLFSQIEEWLISQDMHRIYLEVESGNSEAISFYQKHGFRELSKIKGFYSDGSTAITMEKACKAL